MSVYTPVKASALKTGDKISSGETIEAVYVFYVGPYAGRVAVRLKPIHGPSRNSVWGGKTTIGVIR